MGFDVLVVEDDQAVRTSLKSTLEDAGLSVLTAENGQQVVAWPQITRIDEG